MEESLAWLNEGNTYGVPATCAKLQVLKPPNSPD
jgi:hypothetical protein